MDHQFRNAAIGGFHKQDVLDYLELIVKEHNARMQALQEQLDQAQAQSVQLTQQEAQQTAQMEQLRQENQQLQQKAAQLQEQANSLQMQNNTLHAQLSESENSRKALQEQIDKLLPDANAYIAVKERTAGVELDAHRRAQGVLDQAQDEAQQLHNQMQQWLSRVEREYSDLRSQVDATVSHAAGELGKVGALLDQITQRLAQQDTALEDLEKAYSKCELVKIPAPMPIPEE